LCVEAAEDWSTAILAALYDALADLGKDAELRATMHMQGVKPRGIGIREFDLYIRKDVERLTRWWRQLPSRTDALCQVNRLCQTRSRSPPQCWAMRL
jgi:hypothetical protein